MVPGAAEEARRLQVQPYRAFSSPVLGRMIEAVLPRCRILGLEPLGGGLRNANFKVHFHSAPEPFVLRIYGHDPSLCQKEIDILPLMGAFVPVPEVIGAEPGGLNDTRPFLLMRYVEGCTFLELKRSGDVEAIAQAAYSAGRTLAALGSVSFSKPGWLAPGPTVTHPLLAGPNPAPRFVDECLASQNLQKRMSADLRDRTSAFLWSWAAQPAKLDAATNLVHGDFSRRNLLVRPTAGRWTIAAVLDWEFAISLYSAR